MAISNECFFMSHFTFIVTKEYGIQYQINLQESSLIRIVDTTTTTTPPTPREGQGDSSHLRSPHWTKTKIHLDNLLNKELVRGHFSLLHDGDVAANPGDQAEPSSLGHLVTSLGSNNLGWWVSR